MKRFSKTLFLVLLIALTSSQIVNLSQIFTPQTQATLGPEFQNSDFLRKIDNYFGCKTWQDGHCVECSTGYIFNNNGVCCEIDQNCRTFNRDVGVCEACYTGFYINANGTCTAYGHNDPAFKGCGEWNNGECVTCSPKYYFGDNGACQPVSDQCRDWNRTTGVCTECYFGYIINEGACVVNPSAPRSADVGVNPYCAEWGSNGCKLCAERTFFNADGICQRVNNQCWTWDPVDGLCLTCYRGYDLVNGSCIYSQSYLSASADIGCHIWQEGICVECSPRWVFNNLGSCAPVEDTCRTFDGTGVCQTCYRGYYLVEGVCTWSPENDAAPADPGCKTWNNTVCVECSPNWIQDSNGFCLPVSEDCRTHDANGLCTGCYRGYIVNEGKCVFDEVGNNQAPPQQGCHIWNWNTLTCEQCSSWWHFNQDGVCEEISALCHEYSADGLCTSCYKGYVLTDNGACVVNQDFPTDKGCKTWEGVTCTECSFSYVFNLVGSCISVSDQCKTYNETNGECTSCYHGYSVVNGSCIYNKEDPAKGGCKDWNWDAKICNECSPNWVLLDGTCIAVSDQCRTHADNGWCTACYRGYDLTEHKNDNGDVVSVTCQYSSNNKVIGLPDAGCHIWNWTTNSCQECSHTWWFNNGQCVHSDTYCHTFDAANGFCLSCYRGYDLTEHKNDNGDVIGVTCEYSASNTAAPADKGCRRWNSSGCIECSQNWAFDENGVCQQVSDSCKTHDGFACTSCYHGFVLNEGACELNPLNSIAPSDAGCKDWDWFNQVCKACAPYWFMSNGICIPVSPYCKTYDEAGLCTSCFKGYHVVEGVCERSADKVVSDSGCKTWVWDNDTCTECSPYWVFNQGICTPVSPYCKTYNASNGHCTSCYSGYSLDGEGACQLAPASFCKSSDETGCLTCYQGFVLYQRSCITLDSIANIALYYNECCPQKLAELRAEGRIPQ